MSNHSLKKIFWKLPLKYKFLLIGFTCLLLMVLIVWPGQLGGAHKECFRDHVFPLTGGWLHDILTTDKRPTAGKSIFFHETSCPVSGNLQLTARQACAIESAALANPNLEVFVIFASARFMRNSTRFRPPPIIDAVLSYPNVNLRNVNLWTYAADTPIYEWLKDGQLFDSTYLHSHVSDFLRYLTLWRWGGTYLDLDIVVKQSLENIKPNYAGAESDSHVAAGVINLDHEGFGHEIASACLRNFQMNFDGRDWGKNGPGVITRVLKELCSTKSPQLMTRDRCLGFKVFPIEAFYAVPWRRWRDFFDPERSQSVLKLTNSSIIAHVWNRHSAGELIKVGSKAAYAQFAEKYCPRVYKSCGKYF